MGDRVRLARQKRGLSQEALANKAGASDGYVSMLETQQHIKSFGLVKVLAIAEALAVPLDWLVNGGEEPEWEPKTGSGSAQADAAQQQGSAVAADGPEVINRRDDDPTIPGHGNAGWKEPEPSDPSQAGAP